MKKTILVTGASGGIGSAVAQCFANAGYAVVLQYHTNRENAQKAADAFPEDVQYLSVSCDLCDCYDVERMKQIVHTHIGPISVLINCAGVALPQMLFTDTTDAAYSKIFETNVHGMILVTRAFCDDLRAAHGSVVNLSSVWGVTGGSCETLYSASKAAVIGFTKALAKELAPSDVTVNCVAPGWIATNMTAHLSSEDLAAYLLDTPLGRVGTPEEVAQAIFYLAHARYVTGQVLCCDGGYTI